MKLIMSIVQDEDALKVMDELNANDFPNSIEVVVGGTTIFMIDVERFEKV